MKVFNSQQSLLNDCISKMASDFNHKLFAIRTPNSPQIHPKFTPNSPQIHPKFITNSLQIHPTFTTNSLQIHPKFTPNSPQIHPKFTPNSPQIHHKFTPNSPLLTITFQGNCYHVIQDVLLQTAMFLGYCNPQLVLGQ
jgi:hypothetical protein